MGIAGSNRPSSRASAGKPAGSPRRAGGKAGAAKSNGKSATGAAADKLPLQFTMPSQLAAVRDVHRAIMDQVEKHHYGEQAQFAIRLALEEGLMNAVKHGNKLDAKKNVHVAASVTPTSTEIVIEDEGQGFTRDEVPDPCAVENLLKCSGRGILLMEAYMDEVKYTNGGRRVRMVKKNT